MSAAQAGRRRRVRKATNQGRNTIAASAPTASGSRTWEKAATKR